jgi:SET domain-containing protein
MQDRMKRGEALPRIARRRSAVHGYGVFAGERINKNARIIDYAGELIHNSESEEREERYLAEGCIWVFRVNRNWSRDANVGGNIARFINHACRPNCYVHIVDGTIWIRARRTIRRGEEITYHYNTDGEALIRCRCRRGCQALL